MKKTEESALKLKVTEALSKDVGRAYARMGPEDLEKLQVANPAFNSQAPSEELAASLNKIDARLGRLESAMAVAGP